MAKGKRQPDSSISKGNAGALRYDATHWPASKLSRQPRKFDDLISPLMERISNNLFGSRTLAELRDALLPKLLSGELRVPSAAKLLEART